MCPTAAGRLRLDRVNRAASTVSDDARRSRFGVIKSPYADAAATCRSSRSRQQAPRVRLRPGEIRSIRPGSRFTAIDTLNNVRRTRPAFKRMKASGPAACQVSAALVPRPEYTEEFRACERSPSQTGGRRAARPPCAKPIPYGLGGRHRCWRSRVTVRPGGADARITTPQVPPEQH